MAKSQTIADPFLWDFGVGTECYQRGIKKGFEKGMVMNG